MARHLGSVRVRQLVTLDSRRAGELKAGDLSALPGELRQRLQDALIVLNRCRYRRRSSIFPLENRGLEAVMPVARMASHTRRYSMQSGRGRADRCLSCSRSGCGRSAPLITSAARCRCVLLLFVCFPWLAAQNASITGTVTDPATGADSQRSGHPQQRGYGRRDTRHHRR